MRTIGHTRQERPEPLRILGIGKPCVPFLNGADVPHKACGWPAASHTFSSGRQHGPVSDAGPPPQRASRHGVGPSTAGSDLSSGAHGAPNARAETRWPATGPSPAAPKRAEASAPLSGARPGHGIYLGTPRSRNVAAQPDWVKREKSTGRINAAAVYAEANLDGTAMAASRGGDHAPVSVELARRSGRDRTDDGECGS